ncbi:MAG: hypothetical protein HYX22_01140 [Candidatus Yanofskybacteria bacterium]|nr:hypothetical protein [Candidatus Yanofskybacteria bacterium]
MARRWGKPKSVDWRGQPSSPTSFCIFPIKDEAFSPELKIFLVYNRADKGRNKPLDELLGFGARQGGIKKGKPAAYGMPGGGQNPEWLETTEGAAIREGGNESGIRVTRARLIPIPEKKNKALILDKKTDERTRPEIMYADGQQVHVELMPNEKLLLNPMNYYLADVDWFNSRVREFLVGLKNDLIAEGKCTAEDIAQFGISINTLAREELLALGVDEEEVGKKDEPEELCEIGGFALLPVSLLRWMWENKRFYLNPEEDRENPLEPTTYVYYSHVKRILEGLDIMGVA